MTSEQSFQYLLKLQNNFNKNLSDQIFGDLSDHLYTKWERCKGNILNFLTMLDEMNRGKLLSLTL